MKKPLPKVAIRALELAGKAEKEFRRRKAKREKAKSRLPMSLTNLLRNIRARLIYPSSLRAIRNIRSAPRVPESSKVHRIKLLTMDDLDEPYLPIPAWISQKESQ